MRCAFSQKDERKKKTSDRSSLSSRPTQGSRRQECSSRVRHTKPFFCVLGGEKRWQLMPHRAAPIHPDMGWILLSPVCHSPSCHCFSGNTIISVKADFRHRWRQVSTTAIFGLPLLPLCPHTTSGNLWP